MKIVSPLTNIRELEPIINAGADEIYFGIMDRSWLESYSNLISMNRREFKNCNLHEQEDINKIHDICKKRNIKTSLTLNSHLYTKEQTGSIVRLLRSVKVDNIIVASIPLIITLNKMFPKINIHLSTGGTAFNSESVRFYQKLNVKRIILPRHVSVDEIVSIRKKVGKIELEIFALNQGCINIDGFCHFIHGTKETTVMDRAYRRALRKAFRLLPERSKDWIRWLCELEPGYACLQLYKVHQDGRGLGIFSYNPHLDSGIKCAACSLHRLKDEAMFLKIVGREHPLDKKIKDIKFLADILKNIHLDEEQFARYCKKQHYSYFKERCNPIKCYY